MRYLVCAFVFLAGVAGNVQAEMSQPDALALLKKIEAAARELNYSGIFVYQYGNQVETSKITHYSDATGEHEKLEALNGPARETIRNNDEVICYLPESNSVKVEKRNTRKFFPALLPKDISKLSANYTIKLGEVERIAGYDCQSLILEPKDNLRYAHKFWADNASGLLLKATLLNVNGEVIDQFAFTQITIGGQIDKTQFKAKPAWKTLTWKTDDSTIVDGSAHDTGWGINEPLPGFNKIVELKRQMPGKKLPVSHLVYSDGLSTVSVFIEPLAGMPHPMQGLASQGVLNVYARSLADFQITVIGEVPVATVKKIANSLSIKQK